jgi:alkylation response protein AidB-like acyl-CoA dehydrogenase
LHNAVCGFPYEAAAGMPEMEVFGCPFPDEYGGMGADYFALWLAIEELAKATKVSPSLGSRCVGLAQCRSSGSATEHRFEPGSRR